MLSSTLFGILIIILILVMITTFFILSLYLLYALLDFICNGRHFWKLRDGRSSAGKADRGNGGK